jgi:hypothetical protein
MIRVAQMILARVFYLLENDHKNLEVDENYFDPHKSRRESICDVQAELEKEAAPRREIIKLFLDNCRDAESPFRVETYILAS